MRWASWYLKSPATGLDYTHLLLRGNVGDPWIPHTRGQQCGNGVVLVSAEYTHLLNVCGLSPVSKCYSVMQSLVFTCECRPEMESQCLSSYPDTDMIHIQIHIPFISRYEISHLMRSKRWKSQNWFSVVYCKSQFNARWNLIHVLIFHVVLTVSVHTFYIHLETL